MRYQGEPVALVAADHPEQRPPRGRRDRRSTTRCSSRSPTPERAMEPGAPQLHPAGNLLRHVVISHGDPRRDGRRGGRAASTRSACRTRRSSGPESGLAVPDGEGGVDLYIATQWLHVDRDQVAASLGLPPEQVRLTLGGVGGAFGGREDLSMQVHACLLALHTGRPVKIVYNREESFFGHVHRHPAPDALRARRDDGRAASSTCGRGSCSTAAPTRRARTAVCANAACFALGPYDVPNARVDAYGDLHQQPAVRRDARLRRGAGRVRATSRRWTGSPRHSGMDPVELRLRNAMAHRLAACRPASSIDEPGAGRRAARAPARDAAAAAPARPSDLRELPGGVSNTTHGEGVRRGVGFAVGFKNIGFSEGFDDYSTARVRLSMDERRAARRGPHRGRRGGAGPGHRAGADRAHRARASSASRCSPADTAVGSAGSTSASRQTWMTGGAVQAACEAVRERLRARAAGARRGAG